MNLGRADDHVRSADGADAGSAGCGYFFVNHLQLHLVGDERLLAADGEADLDLPQRPVAAHVGDRADAVLRRAGRAGPSRSRRRPGWTRRRAGRRGGSGLWPMLGPGRVRRPRGPPSPRVDGRRTAAVARQVDVRPPRPGSSSRNMLGIAYSVWPRNSRSRAWHRYSSFIARVMPTKHSRRSSSTSSSLRQAPLVRQDALLHREHVDDRELQPLGRVQRHHRDAVRLLVPAVHVAAPA